MTDSENSGDVTPRGEVRYQDPDSTTPRAPSVAEQRARRKAAEEAAAAEQAAQAAAERKAALRKRIMIGGGVTVGVVALVAAYYASKPDDVTAYCTSQNGAVQQQEQVCDASYVNSHGGYVSGGFFFLPIVGGGFQSYHYNYGGTVHNGHVTGGSNVKPNNANIKSKSGKVIQRGGFGVGGHGKSGGS
ncbi:MAG: hypothetical protein ACRDRN_10830 [Sciscionella sp.]